MSDHDRTLVEKEPAFNQLREAENGPNHGTHAEDQEKVIVYLKGWRFHTLTFA